MRILVVSNLYPPFHIGGYELGCYEIVERLKARGHHIDVLTSNYKCEGRQSEDGIHRRLMSDLIQPTRSFPADVWRVFRKQVHNQTVLRRTVAQVRPDIIYIFNLTGLSTSLGLLAESTGRSVCYFISDRWLANWDKDPWHQFWSTTNFRLLPARVAKRLIAAAMDLGRIVHGGTLALRQVQFVSQYLKDDAAAAGKPVSAGEVIHWGVDTELFQFQERKRRPLRLLYVGQVVEMKGVRTLVEAMRVIVCEKGRSDVFLSIVGGSSAPEFEAEMRGLVDRWELGAQVSFVGQVHREDLPEVYSRNDILVFPSNFEEAFSLTTLEAMACGLPIVSTATGGNSEVMRDGENALVFRCKDAETCAGNILKLLENHELYHSLSLNGRATVENAFRIDEMIDRIEKSLALGLNGQNEGMTLSSGGPERVLRGADQANTG
jgi:glycosyltransferase involved in cell wall biosynthesis